MSPPSSVEIQVLKAAKEKGAGNWLHGADYCEVAESLPEECRVPFFKMAYGGRWLELDRARDRVRLTDEAKNELDKENHGKT